MHCHCAHRHPHSFPTRRSSDLEAAKDFGVTDDRARLALMEAGMREGQKVGDWKISATVAEIFQSPTFCHSRMPDRKSTRLNSSHPSISYAVFCLQKKTYILISS